MGRLVAGMEIAVEAVYTQFIVTLLLLLEFTLTNTKKKKFSPQGNVDVYTSMCVPAV